MSPETSAFDRMPAEVDRDGERSWMAEYSISTLRIGRPRIPGFGCYGVCFEEYVHDLGDDSRLDDVATMVLDRPDYRRATRFSKMRWNPSPPRSLDQAVMLGSLRLRHTAHDLCPSARHKSFKALELLRSTMAVSPQSRFVVPTSPSDDRPYRRRKPLSWMLSLPLA